MSKVYVQHSGKAVEDRRFGHTMAIALDPRSNYRRGVIRVITSREGDVGVKGYVDRSGLYKVSGENLERFVVGEQLRIKGEEEILGELGKDQWEFIGFEDPDIFIDEAAGLMHLYFTMPLLSKDKTKEEARIHLGHAVGKDLDSLKMAMPALQADAQNTAKEVSVAPQNSKGVRLNLFESSIVENKVWYSTIRVGIAKDMNEPWQFGDTLFHPKERGIPWAGGHASPGPLLPKTFIDVGENKLLGIMNGREMDQQISDETKYGIFSVGLFIYDYETGKIDWVSPEPLIRDSEAKTITFASQFVETVAGEGVLYAHVDDSFVRAYTLYAEGVKSLL